MKSDFRIQRFSCLSSILLIAFLAIILSAAGCVSALAQAPLALPNTITSIGGGAASSPGVGTPCAPGSPYTATDSLGDGCPASLVALGADNRAGIAADNFGNIFVLDNSNSALRMIDPRSGLITLIAGKGTACASKTDSGGDGCVAATQTVLNGPRGVAVDPYGNVLIAGYSSNFVNIVCRAVSPLCSASQIGNMYRVAGYASSVSSSGTAVAGTTAGSAGDGTPAFSTVATTGVNGPRGVAADQFGNVYIGDTTNVRYRVVVGPASFNGVTNPLASLIAINPTYSSATAATASGIIYPLAGGFSGTPGAGAFCNGSSGAKALDTLGNGCPYYLSSAGNGNTGDAQGLAVDPAGDIIIPDVGNVQVRVIYMGGAQMANIIIANNQGNANWIDAATSLKIGSIYLIAGKGTTTISATPTLGSKTSIGNTFKITLDALGNIYLGDSSGSRVDFIDINTGYIRALFASGTNCAASTNAFGDGCPASQSTFNGSNGLGVAVDNLGNLYLDDASGLRIRKVSAASLIPTAVGSTTNQTIKVHLAATAPSTAATGMTASFAASSPEIVAGAVSCAAANADFSLDCSVPITFTPAAPGMRSATLTVAATTASSGGTPVNLILSGYAQGGALAIDSSATASSTLGSGLHPQSVALDGAGNVYTMDTNASRFTKIAVDGAVSQLPGTLPTTASQITVDTQGNIYAVGAGTSAITKLTLTGPASWTAGTVSYTPPITPAQPQAIAVDSNNTIYVYDQANTAIYKISQSSALQPLTKLAGGFSNVVALALDPSGNLYVADKGAQHVYKITQNGVQTTVTTAATITPTGVATDAAGDLFIQDAASGSIIQVSISGPGSVSNQTNILSGLITPNGIAVDGNGNVYSSDAVNASIIALQRGQASNDFGINIATSLNATLTNAGNTVATGYAQSDASDFQLSSGATNGCSLASSSIAVGYACTISASFAPSGSGTGPVTDALTLAPAASSVGVLTLGGTKTGTAVTTTTTISGQTPASPVYGPSGTEVSVTVTVTPSSGSVSGTNVQVTVDGGSPASYVLSGTSAVVALSGLAAGSHGISATYVTQAGIIGSSSTVTSFAIAQQSTGVTWTPATTTLQVSQPVGTSVLNASSGGVLGLFSYTATPSGGSPIGIDASTYLPIGNYSLGVTFTPNDGVDYAPSTGSVASLTITKANTTAAVGATQNLVTSDGTGNYTSVQSAINALPPTSGGSIYVAPGTYSGFVTVNTPFISLRGLGGNPANVILANENGAFSAPFLPGQGPGNGGSSGDQGSSTMVVAKGTAGGTTYIPNAFYMENLTVANTYDTDSTNSNTNAVVGGACTAGQPANNNQALFNAGTLCNSQALALWITADQTVLNNVQLTSLQDTLYAGSQGCGAPCVSARQYFWKGRINGDVDYIFGDAAAVFDHTVFYTAYHGASATGTDTIEAQNKKAQTGSVSDYLSGYVLNHAYLLSQSAGMTNLYYGRPYGQYSTYVMLNSFVDQVNPTGWIEFSGDTNLPTSTYAEFNTQPYVDPATGGTDTNSFIYAGGGSTGAGVTGVRETISTNPGTLEASNAVHTTLTAAQAAQYYPVAFLASPVPTPNPSFVGFTNTWDPTAALANGVNSFVPTGGSITINANSSVTILVRPQTPGGGVVPTGTYAILDGATTIASGTLDASGEAYFTTKSFASGTHNITTSYGGDANFNPSSSATPFVLTVNSLPATATTLGASATAVSAGASVALTATVSTASGIPTGTVVFTVGATTLGSVTLPVNGIAILSTTSLPIGTDNVVATYSGDSNFSGSSNNITVTVSGTLSFNTPSLTFTTQTDGTNSSPTAVVLTNGTGSTIANISVTAPAGFTIGGNTCPASFANGANCGFNVTFSPNVGQVGTISGNVIAAGSGFSASLPVSGVATAIVGAPAVATGDTRTVTEPSFPATCQSLTATFHDVNEDVPTSVEAVSTKLDQARVQAALNACSGSNHAVELSMDASGNNAFLTGPISIPTGVTLLLDPGVTLYFSRNVQDYDTVQGTHTCGTVNNASNTASCQNLITITNANNSGIMGYGKLNGRGGSVLLNSFATSGFEGTTAGKSWWDLAADADALGASQQNPRGIQISKSTNITFYKFTYKNAPNFHVALSGVTGFTAWDIKIITPYTSRNTDGIDPSGTVNATITQSWISDGDDNIAVGGSGAASANISIINNHFFAGHGESIGSITTNGVSNVLFDNNAMYGDADVDGSNSTAIRIKSANDRGNVVQNIQYSNSCFANHGTQIQFTPVYNTNTGTLTPNFKNILLQNLRFSNQGPVATGLVQLLGASNNGTINPLIVTFDNVTIDTLAASNLTSPTNAQITFGPGQVSNTLTSLLLPFNGKNGDVITDNRTAASLVAPPCNFTFLIPELTSSTGASSQTVTAGQIPTAVVILAPAVASASYPYPTGTVTLTDEANRTFTATLSGNGDTTFIPITNAPAGTHTYTASYAGNAKYPAIASFGSLTITVNAGSLPGTSVSLGGVPPATTFGTGFAATATVAGASPTGSVSFLVNGGVYATVPVSAGSATYNFNLPFGSYTISAVYGGDATNAGSTSATFPVTVNGALTTTSLTTSATTTVVGTPVSLTATVASGAGTPTGTVSFSYTTSTNSTPTVVGSATLSNGVANFSALLPQGIDNVSANYAGSGNFAASPSTALTITVNAAPPVPISAAPVAMPYTITTLVGGGSATANTTCTGHLDTFGDGCIGTAVQITGGTAGDLRGVTVDPFGNVYFTDANANLVRKVTPSGIVTQFAGYISGTACVPTAIAGCTPTLVKLNKPRGIYADPLGNIFIAGYSDNKVQEVKVADGKMYLVSGTGTASANTTDNAGDGGPAASANLKQPRSVGSDAAGNIYISDTGDFRIREVLNPASGLPGAGNIQTVAGTGVSSSTGDGGLATQATFNNPQGVLVDSNANIYIADTSKVRVVCVTCAPGAGLYNLLVALGVSSPVNGNIYTVAGTGTAANATLQPGLATAVNMGPQKLAMDADANLYIVDSSNNVVWFEDSRTGYTRVIAGGGTATSCAASTIGDGCVATQAIIGSNGGNGIGVALDQQNNMYISDSTNLRIRKVSNNLRFAASPVGTPVAQTVQLHFVAGDAPTAAAVTSPDFTLSAPACTVNAIDNSDDCTYTTTFNPKVAGTRAAPLSVSTVLHNTGYFGLTGTGQGAGATLDPASQLAFGNNVSVNAVATDNAGNVYVADGTSKTVLKYGAGASSAGTGALFTNLGTFTNPSALAVDSLGNVFVADASVGSVTQISPAGVLKTLPTGFLSPQGLAIDSLNNLYVTDSAAKTVTEIGSNLLGTRVIASTGLQGPFGVAVDTSANVFVADPAASAVYRYDAQSLARTSATTAAVTPKAVAVDAAGNVLVGDFSSSSILAVPASSQSAPFTVASGLPANALALDSAGNLYTASATGAQVLELVRTQGLTAFSGAGASPITVELLSTGNLPANLTLNDPNQTDFSLVLNPSTDCASPTSVLAGGACQFTSSFTPGSYGPLNNIATFSGNAANASLATPPTLEIVQTGTNPLLACVTTLAGKATASTGLQPARAALTWTPVASVAGFNVLRSMTSGGAYTLLGSTTSPAYADTNGLINTDTYFYVVQPTNASGAILCQSNQATVAVPKGR